MRDRLLDLLLTAVAAGWLSNAEAGAVLRAYDAGTLSDDAVRALLPLPPREAALALTTDALAASLYRLHVVAGLSGGAARRAALGGVVRVVEGERYRAVVRVVEDYDAKAFRLARRLAQGGDVGAWQRDLGREVRSEILGSAQLGYGRAPLPSEAARIREILDSEASYLARFADEVSARRALAEATGDPSRAMSEAAIRERARMYGGASQELFFRGVESRETRPGYLYRFESRDDGGTCGPCREADKNGPYLAGQGPYPGVVCRAKGKCRCRRVKVYAPAEYARLTNQTAEA